MLITPEIVDKSLQQLHNNSTGSIGETESSKLIKGIISFILFILFTIGVILFYKLIIKKKNN